MQLVKTRQVLARVSRRLSALVTGQRWYQITITIGVLGLALLIVGRLLGLLGEWAAWWQLAAWPLAGLLIAMLLVRRPGEREAARAVDSHVDGKDLFLTALRLDRAPGEYKDVVLRDAEERAATVVPAAVVPWHPWPALGRVALIAGLFAVCLQWLPSFDPFGFQAEERALAERRERLEESEAITASRKAAIEHEQPDAELSEEVEQTLEELKQAFQQMKPEEQEKNRQEIREFQNAMGEQFRRRQLERLSQAMDEQEQQFGSSQDSELEEAGKKMAAGDSSAMEQQLQQMQQLAQQLADEKDPAKRQELEQKLKRQLQRLQQQADKMDAQSMSDSARRALEQLAMQNMQGLSQEALQALQNSLDLAQLDAQRLAQNMRDLQQLEQALQAAQMAQQCNNAGQLSGGMCQGASSIAEYARCFGSGMGQCNGQGQGSGMGQGMGSGSGNGGMGGQGQGRGGRAPEDDSIATGWQTERSQSALQAGRILMSWETQELGEEGEVTTQRQAQIEAVRQGLSEAIVHEQVPAGYHESIKNYFDDLAASGSTSPTTAPAPGAEDVP